MMANNSSNNNTYMTASIRPPTRPPPLRSAATTTATSAGGGSMKMTPPKIPPRPNISALASAAASNNSTTTSPVRTVKNSIFGGLLRRFPTSSADSPPSASALKKNVTVGTNTVTTTTTTYSSQKNAIPLEVSFDVDVVTSPKNRGLGNNRAKVYSSPAATAVHYLEKEFDLLCNVSMESEALAKGQPLFRKRYALSDFDLGVTLGTGSFGRVKFAKFLSPLPHETKSGLAIKMLNKDLVKRQNQVEHIKHEKNILAALSTYSLDNEEDDFDFDEEREPWMPAYGEAHPFIVKMFGTFQTTTYLFMVLEYVPGGEFFTHLRIRGHFKNHEAYFYASAVASVFAFLHSRSIAYRDLKPENLLLDHRGYIKVVDFGFAKRIPDNKTFTLCGTPEYIAPEVLMNAGHGKGVDWWALGVLTYEMLSGVSPFSDADTLTIYKKICKGLQAYPSYFEPDARSFVRRLLQVDVKKRYGCLANGAEDVLMHRWLLPIDHELLLQRKLDPPFVPPTTGQEDTSCFEDYPYNPEDDCLGQEKTDEDPDFEGFSTVC